MNCLEENLDIFFVINLNKQKRTELLARLLITSGVGAEGRKINIDFAARVNESQMWLMT
jgi:hypothetical protein